MTYWKLVSLDRRLSDRKNPSSSEESLDRFQNWLSVSSFGGGAAAIDRTAVAAPVSNRQTRNPALNNRAGERVARVIASYVTAGGSFSGYDRQAKETRMRAPISVRTTFAAGVLM